MAFVLLPQSKVSTRLGMNYKGVPLWTACPQCQERQEHTLWTHTLSKRSCAQIWLLHKQARNHVLRGPWLALSTMLIRVSVMYQEEQSWWVRVPLLDFYGPTVQNDHRQGDQVWKERSPGSGLFRDCPYGQCWVAWEVDLWWSDPRHDGTTWERNSFNVYGRNKSWWSGSDDHQSKRWDSWGISLAQWCCWASLRGEGVTALCQSHFSSSTTGTESGTHGLLRQKNSHLSSYRKKATELLSTEKMITFY